MIKVLKCDINYEGLFKIWLSIGDERGIGKSYKIAISMSQFYPIHYEGIDDNGNPVMAKHYFELK